MKMKKKTKKCINTTIADVRYHTIEVIEIGRDKIIRLIESIKHNGADKNDNP